MPAQRITLDELIYNLKLKAINHSEYYHYTRLKCYEKMLQKIDLPENGGAHRLLWLTPATKTNDGMERKYGDYSYLGCFTYSPYENVGMWFMYGKGKSDAIRIGFNNEALKAWLYKGAKGSFAIHVDVYGVVKKCCRTVYEKIPQSEIEDVSLYDVAYVLSKDEIAHHNWDGNVEWHRDYYCVMSADKDIVNSADERLVSDDFTDNVCNKLPFCFKKKGWSGEREVRLVVTLKSRVRNRFCHIAIPFDEPLEYIENNAKGSIVASPWITSKESRMLKLNGYTQSVFYKELNVI